MQRSELAVPGSNPQIFEKAAASDADFVFLDLEDAVAPGDKVEARRNVIEALQDIDWQGLGKGVAVVERPSEFAEVVGRILYRAV